MEANGEGLGTALEQREIVSASLAGGGTVFVEVRAAGDTEVDVAGIENLPFGSLAKGIESIARELTGAIAKAKPKRAAVELGLDVGVEAGALTAMLVKGSGNATLKVTLEWESEG